ncbi:MAG: MBL fold metallo-hydrolase [Chloroflexi bacterium]|nr:MBL fold metallo-hydrolase [Chloroflexota bacterium]
MKEQISDQTFSVTFWGVRGGYPKPGPTTTKFGGNTTCIEVRAGNHLIIIDAGTGIIGLGEDLVARHIVDKKPVIATIIFTHTHHDHTQGFPFFTPSHLGSSVMYIFGPRLLHQDLEAVLEHAMLPPVFPVRLDELSSMQVIRNISNNETITFSGPNAPPQVCNAYHAREECSPSEVRIKTMRSYAHPGGGVFHYRVEMNDKKVVIATDTEGYVGGDRRLIQFSHGADLLIHDAEFTSEEYINGIPSKQGWGHSSWEMAVKVAQAAGVKALALTHHNALHDDAFLDDVEQQTQAVFPGALMAREGLTLKL